MPAPPALPNPPTTHSSPLLNSPTHPSIPAPSPPLTRGSFRAGGLASRGALPRVAAPADPPALRGSLSADPPPSLTAGSGGRGVATSGAPSGVPRGLPGGAASTSRLREAGEALPPAVRRRAPPPGARGVSRAAASSDPLSAADPLAAAAAAVDDPEDGPADGAEGPLEGEGAIDGDGGGDGGLEDVSEDASSAKAQSLTSLNIHLSPDGVYVVDTAVEARRVVDLLRSLDRSRYHALDTEARTPPPFTRSLPVLILSSLRQLSIHACMNEYMLWDQFVISSGSAERPRPGLTQPTSIARLSLITYCLLIYACDFQAKYS